ncbi:MAG: hypothetical protein ACC656_15120, partial [Candidatus Heimdallarchaeota archaeon]
ISLEDKDEETKKLLEKVGSAGKDTEDMKKTSQMIDELQIELEAKNAEIQKLSDEVGSVEKDSEELKKVKQKLVELQNALETKDALIIKLGQKGKSSESGPETLEKANEEIKQLKEELNTKDVQMDENLKQLEITFEELDDLKIKIKSLESTSSAAVSHESPDEDKQKLQKELQAVRMENEVLERKLNDIEAKHKVDIQNSIEEMKKISQDVSKSSMTEQVESLNTEIQTLKNSLKEKDLQIENSNSKNNEFNYKVESLELELQKLKLENEKLVETTKKIDQYEMQIEELKSVQTIAQTESATSTTIFQSQSAPPTIQDYLDSSKLAENIAAILDNQKSLKLRFLA